MWYIAFCIVLTSYLTLTFKMLGNLKINSFQAIVFNYITCVITGSIFTGGFPLNKHTFSEPWLIWGVVMGLLFVSVFNLIAWCARTAGVSITSVANKLSLVIPFILSVYLYGEEINFLNILGILLALVSVVLVCYPSAKMEGGQPQGSKSKAVWILPVILFICSGLLDSMLKYVESNFITREHYNAYLVTTFLSAATGGSLLLLYQYISGIQKFSGKALLAGVLIGIPNYFSIWTLLKALESFPGKSAMVIPVNNMGIVLFSAIAAWFIFKEKLSMLNKAGIVLALLAIGLIAFG